MSVAASLITFPLAVAFAQDGPELVRRFDAPEERQSSFPSEVSRSRSALIVHGSTDGYLNWRGLYRVRDANTPPEELRSRDVAWNSYGRGLVGIGCDEDCVEIGPRRGLFRVGFGGAPREIASLDGTDNGAWSIVGRARGIVFVAVRDESHGTELWRTDGTADGTWIVRDIDPGPGSSDPRGGVTVGSVVFFSARTAAHGRELWRTDGTPDGTVLVSDLRPGTVSSSPTIVGRIGGRAIVAGAAAGGVETLWITDGSRKGLRVLERNLETTGPGSALGELVVFRGTGAGRSRELWRTDGTRSGTSPLAEVSSTDEVTAGGEVWFDGRVDGTYGLWRTDGSESGTRLVWSPDGGWYIRGIEVLGDVVFFRAATTSASALWRTDGTPDGTWPVVTSEDGVKVAHFPGINAVYDDVSVFAATEQALFFSGERDGEVELWVTDGTHAGTREVDLLPDRAPALHELEAGTDALYVAATEAETGPELWTSDGTPAGTSVLTELAPGPAYSYAGELTALGDGIVFAARGDAAAGSALWRADAGAAKHLVTLPNVPGQGHARLFTRVADLVYFIAPGVAAAVAYRTDGTTAGTLQLTGPTPVAFHDLNGTALFFAQPPFPHDMDLWRSDGSVQGTELVHAFRPNEGLPNAGGGVAIDDQLFFAANGGLGHELWRTDGTPGGTVMDIDLVPGLEGANVGYMAAVGDDLYLSVFERTRDPGLYVRRRSGAVQRVPGVGVAHDLTTLGDQLLFVADDGELWRTDGTVDGTLQLRDIEPGDDRSYPRDFVAVGAERVVFVATDAEHGSELWTTDGTRAGTLLVADLVPGPAGSVPENIVVRGDNLYVVADGSGPSRDLWRIPLAYLDTLEEPLTPPMLPLQPLVDPGPVGPEPAPAPPPEDVTAPSDPPEPLVVKRLRLIKEHARADLRARCRVPLAGNRGLGGEYLIVDVGGVNAEVTLDRHGRGKTADGWSVRARVLPKRRGRPRALLVTLRIRRGGADVLAQLADEDLELPNPLDDVTTVERTIDVSVEWRHRVHQATTTVRYRERQGLGRARLVD